MTICLILLWRAIVLNRRDINEERKNDNDTHRRHCREDGSGSCKVDEDLWFRCLCIPNTPHHDWDPVDGHIEIIAPPGMLGTWKLEVTRWYDRRVSASDDNIVWVTAHNIVGKGGEQMLKYRNLLSGDRVELPEEGDADCVYIQSERHGKVLSTALSGKYQRGYPRLNSSRLVVITSYQSWEGQVKRAADTMRYLIYPGAKAWKAESKEFYLINPALVIIDEAHECQDKFAGHFSILNHIEGMCNYQVKKIFLTGTPIRKSPGDLEAMIWSLQTPGWDEKDHFLYGLRVAQITKLKSLYEKVKTPDDPGLHAVIQELSSNIHQLLIRRTGECRWHGSNLREPILSSRQDHRISFPQRFSASLSTFDEKMRASVMAARAVKQQVPSRGIQASGADTSIILNLTRRYRMVASLPYLAEFWSKEDNADQTLLATQTQAWLNDDARLDKACPLHRHIGTILNFSPKLDFIGSVLDKMVDGEGKLVVLTEFLVVGYFVAEVCLRPPLPSLFYSFYGNAALFRLRTLTSSVVLSPSVKPSWVLNALQYIRRHRSKKTVMLYHSGVSRKTRDEMIAGFQKNIDPSDVRGQKLVAPSYNRDAIVGTFRVMGLGITLTAADRVILMEPNTMPSTEAQGIARVVRITQSRMVYVARLLCPDVKIESNILDTNALRSYFVEETLKGPTQTDEKEVDNPEVIEV